MKVAPFLLCTIVLSIPGFAARGKPPENQSQLQGEPLNEYAPAYNAPAAFDVDSKFGSCPHSDITLFFDASFIYWYAGEEGLKIASNGVSNSGVSYFAYDTKVSSQSFDYHPGLKVAAGIMANHEWTVLAEYTWLRGKSTHHSGARSGTESTEGTAAASSGTSVWVVDDWFLQGTSSGQALSGSNVSSSWRLALDLIDAVASRPFYQGRSVVMSPFAGLRTALIRQSMTVNLTESAGLFASLPSQPITSHNHSNSWGIGPRIGCDASWLLPMGFRLEGDFAASLLYTKYTSVKHSEDIASAGFNPGPYTASLHDYSCIRPMAELGLGFGWGQYIYNRDYHIDFSASYDFMMFWSQNMMRKLLDDTLTGTSPSSADLYLHGLTVTGRFDF